MATWTCFRSDEYDDEEHLDLQEIDNMAESVGGKDSAITYLVHPKWNPR
jgi:hypothetical protein